MLCHSHALIDEPATADGKESLQLTGYVRGAALSVNRLVHALRVRPTPTPNRHPNATPNPNPTPDRNAYPAQVHVPGFGDFPIRKLEILADPHRPRRTGAAGAADAAAAEAGSSMDTDGAAVGFLTFDPGAAPNPNPNPNPNLNPSPQS